MSKQQMIANFVVLYRKDGGFVGIYVPGSVFARVPTIKIANFLRSLDTHQSLRTKPGEHQFASVVKYDYSTGKVLNVEMHDRNDSVKDPLDFMQRLLDSPIAKEGLDLVRRAKPRSEGFLEIYEKSKENTLPVLKEMDFQPPGETIYCFENRTRKYLYFCIVRPLGTNNAVGAFQIRCKPTPEDIIHVDGMWYVVGTGKIVGMDCLNREQGCWEPAHPEHIEEMQEFLDAPNQRAELRKISEDMHNSPPPLQDEVRICSFTMVP